MTSISDVGRQAQYHLNRLQLRMLAVENAQPTRQGLHWGQFVMSGQPNSQTGVYGSSCAAIILRLSGRDDGAARRAVSEIENFLQQPDADAELGHNIKLAMVCLALAPQQGAEANHVLLTKMSELLGRYTSAQSLWPAYSKPNNFAKIQFTESPSEVATALIIIFLYELRKRMTHQAQQNLIAQLDLMLANSATALENAYLAARATSVRHSDLLATAILLVKGRLAMGIVRAGFKEAVRKRDFSDRKVFFYDCLRPDKGSPSRDYFILPAATLLPLVGASDKASGVQSALALDLLDSMLKELDNDGVFKGGQDLPSTVEQGLVGLSLQSIEQGASKITFKTHAARIWLYITQASPSGKPTKVVYVLVVFLWLLTITLTCGKFMPDRLHNYAIAKWLFDFSKNAPDAATQFLAFVTAAWPASRVAFMRLMRKGDGP